MPELGTVDVIALVLLAAALLRGLWLGAVRESFSLAALAAACLAVRYAGAPTAAWLAERSPVELGELGARIAAGAVLALGAIAAVGIVGRVVRGGVRAVGLGLADRVAGGFLGAAEGALVVALLLWSAIALVGREHPALAGSRALDTFERVEAIAQGDLPSLPPVASPGP